MLIPGCTQYQVTVRDDPKTNIRTVFLEMDHQIDNWDPFRLQMPSGKYLREITARERKPAEFHFILYAVPSVGEFKKQIQIRINSATRGTITDFRIDRVTVKSEYYRSTGDIPIDFSRPSGIGRETKTDMDTITYKIIEFKVRFPKEFDRAVTEGTSLTYRLSAGKNPVIISVTGQRYEKIKEFFSTGAPQSYR